MRRVEDCYALYINHSTARTLADNPFIRFDQWIRSVDSYGGNDLLYFNSQGTIPEAAVIKKDQRRENPFKERRIFDYTGLSTSQPSQKPDGSSDEDEVELKKHDLAETEG